MRKVPMRPLRLLCHWTPLCFSRVEHLLVSGKSLRLLARLFEVANCSSKTKCTKCTKCTKAFSEHRRGYFDF
ncbi:hypothetical protein BJ912DRAFT_535703 [Pholiota molesta]|nr:hypothetical protein BJ912DRAFT_535703 [Pholiota molesta]